MSVEHTQSVASGLGNLGISILAEKVKLCNKSSVANISENREDNRQVFTPFDGFFQNRDGLFARLDQKHSRKRSNGFVLRTQSA
jgi:hypothetical protein